jgi:hypothetical protein
MKKEWKIHRISYIELMKLARREAKEDKEICGFLIDNGYFLQLQLTQNASEKKGSFSYSKKEVRELMKCSNKLGL